KVTLDQLKADFGKRGSLEKKYLESLERAKELEKQLTERRQQEIEAAKPKGPTFLDIARQYDPVAETIIEDMKANGLLDAEFIELNPRTIKTMVGQMRFMAEWLSNLQGVVGGLKATVDQDLGARQHRSDFDLVNARLDAIANSDKMFEGL